MNKVSASNLLLMVFFLMQFGTLKTLALNYTITDKVIFPDPHVSMWLKQKPKNK